jgi:carboxylesterase
VSDPSDALEFDGISTNGVYPVLPGAEPFFLPGGPTGVLLLHGFTSSPAEIRPLGGFLAELGYTVYSPLLAGHGTAPEHLRATTWQDWVDSALEGLPVLAKAGCTRVALVGLSLGGSISLYLAEQRPADFLSVVTINSPVFIPTIFQPALRWLGEGLLPFFDKGITDLPATEPGRHSLTYSRTPLESVSALIAFLDQVNTGLPQVETPTLVIYSRRDRLVPSFNAMRIYSTIHSLDKHLMVIHGGRHVLTLGPDAPRTFDAIGQFLERHTESGPPI